VEWSTEGLKFGQVFANQIRRRLPAAADKWHIDEVVLTIAGVKRWPWRAVDQNGMVLDILVQSRRDTRAAKRLLCKLLKRQCRPPRVMITDKLASYGAAKRAVIPTPAFHRRCRWNLCRLRPRSSPGSTRGSTTGRRTRTSPQDGESGK